jgi:hypothetical protein
MQAFVNWFDVDNPEHMAAWDHLKNVEGLWPKDFIPEGVSIHNSWEGLMASKIQDAWMAHVLGTPRRWKPIDDEVLLGLNKGYGGRHA